MTFKPTHRISTELWGAKAGTLVQQIVMPETEEGFAYETVDGTHFSGSNRYIDPIPQEEPVKLEPGKRYRISFDGLVNEYGMFIIESQVDDPNERQFHSSVFQHRTTTEALPDPLPATPGSRARVGDDVFVRNENNSDCPEYAWVRINRILPGVAVYRSDAEMVAAGAVAVHDAGTE